MVNKNAVQDAITMMNVILHKYKEIHKVENDQQVPSAQGNSESIQKAIAAAFCCNVAILDQQRGPGLKYVYKLWKARLLADAFSNINSTQSKPVLNSQSAVEKSSQIILTPSPDSFMDVAPTLPQVVVFHEAICNGSYDQRDDSLLRYCADRTLGHWPVYMSHLTPIKLE